MVQTIVLNQLGLMYSGERRGLEVAEIYQALPVTLARRKRIFTSALSSEKVSQLQLPLAQRWQLWVLDGERGRTGFAVWVSSEITEFSVLSASLLLLLLAPQKSLGF